MTSRTGHTLLNGIETELIATGDRGLQFGDGLFETICLRDGHLEYWDQHYARLQQDADTLEIECPDEAVLLDDIRKLVQRRDAHLVVKIILTRGTGGRGYAIADGLTPNRIVSVSDIPARSADFWTQGILATRCKHRLSSNSQLAGVKHLNRLDNVLARKELGRRYQEGIVYDQADKPIEGSMSNLFCVLDGKLYTSGITDCGIDGIIRQRIISLSASTGDSCTIRLTEDMLKMAEEIFFCNSLIGIWPVRQLDEISLQRGPVTTQLISSLRSDTKEHSLAVQN